MKFPNWIKIVLWLAVVAFLIFIIAQRYSSFIAGNANAFDITVFVILIAVLLAPLYKEVDILGVRFKNDIESLKNEMSRQILDLKSYIHNSISIQSHINPQINFVMPSIEDLNTIKNNFEKKAISETPSITYETIETPDDAKYLFSVRYMLERELNRIWKAKADDIEISGRPRIPFELIQLFGNKKLIDDDTDSALRDVYSICSAAIHGKDVSKARVDFVKFIFPRLIAQLKQIV